MKQIGLIFLTLMLTQFAFGGWAKGTLVEQKRHIRQHLLARKKGFDKYLKKRQQMDKKRRAKAYQQKILRKAYEEKKEQARKNFHRSQQQAFPQQAYKEFLRKRQQQRQKLEQARKEYVKFQEELEKVFKNEKYRIDGKKEFNL